MDVVVVGAGVGGLTAAHRLIEAGMEVCVLEARDRVGGRLHSVSREGAGVDLGATWFWANERRVRELVTTLGLGTHPQHIEGDALYHDPRGVHRLAGNPVEGPAARMTSGMQALADALARRLPAGVLQLDRAVVRIRRTDRGVEVVGGDAPPVQASDVVLAVPPALAVARIAFEPGLPAGLAGLAARTPVWMGAMTKVVARYREPFWRTSGLAGAVVSHVGPLREIHDMSGRDGRPAALFGFAPPVRPGAPTVARPEVLAQLAQLFGPAAAEPEELLIHDWRREVHTSPPGVEGLVDYAAFGHLLFRRPALDGRLHWASTETSTEVPGHVEGALAAGTRAASAILAGLPA